DPLVRGEWEDVVIANRPDPDAPQTGSLLPRDAWISLQPIFVTKVARTAFLIEPMPGSRVEAAIDTGEISSPAARAAEPVSEIEFELKHGDPVALYDLALFLLDAAPVRVALQSKAERGYRLAAGNAPDTAAVHAPPL